MTGDDPVQLKLSVRELEVIDRSLKTVKAFGLPEPQREPVEDALQVVDVVLRDAGQPIR